MGRKKGEKRKTDNYSFQAKDPNIRKLLDNQKNINESIRKILLHHINKYGYGEIDQPDVQFQMLQEIYGGGNQIETRGSNSVEPTNRNEITENIIKPAISEPLIEENMDKQKAKNDIDDTNEKIDHRRNKPKFDRNKFKK